MAAGDSPTSISNLALAMLGEDPIANVAPPDANKRGRLCAQFYDPCRRAMLNAHPWREAKRQLQAAANSVAPPFTYAAVYTLPADYIRMYELPEDGGTAWEIMNLAGIGRCLVTDAGAPADASYIFDLEDCTQMSPLLVLTIACDMAAFMAIPLTRDGSAKDRAEADELKYLGMARTASAQQASPRTLDTDVLLRSRW